MKANETKLSKLIEGTNQYVVPHFQRPYTWKRKDWDAIWENVVDLLPKDDPGTRSPEHFIGSIVTAPAHSVPEGVTKYLLIDGQQRLTTLLLLLSSLRDRARDLGDARLEGTIHELYLTNRYQDGADQFKLLPTQGDEPNQSDRLDFQAIILRTEMPKGSGGIAAAYRYFCGKLLEFDLDNLVILQRAILSRVLLVSITLEPGDNPYAIFESLNATGQPLSQADLLRNLFFMSINSSRHDEIYKRKWVPMEQAVGRDNMEEFLRHYLISDGAMVRQADVYFQMKQKLDRRGRDQAEAALDELVAAANRYARLQDPGREPSPEVALWLSRLNALRATVCYPFLLRLFEERERGKLGHDELVDILQVLENFILRRYVADVIRAELNNVFATLYNSVKPYDTRAVGVREILGSRNYPSDAEFTAEITTRHFYAAGGEVSQRAKFILERMEAFESTKELVDTAELQIEHVMPQTLTEAWREHLGGETDDVHQSRLHVLGNLTLTGRNQELSNFTFSEKRLILANSNLALNRSIAKRGQWGAQEIDERGRELAELALRVWPNFAPGAAARRIEVRGKKPVSVHIIGGEHAVQSWQDVLRTTIITLAGLGDDVLPNLAERFPQHLSLTGRDMRHARPLTGGYVYESHMNAEQAYRACTRIVQHLGLASAQWHVRTSDEPPDQVPLPLPVSRE